MRLLLWWPLTSPGWTGRCGLLPSGLTHRLHGSPASFTDCCKAKEMVCDVFTLYGSNSPKRLHPSLIRSSSVTKQPVRVYSLRLIYTDMCVLCRWRSRWYPFRVLVWIEIYFWNGAKTFFLRWFCFKEYIFLVVYKNTHGYVFRASVFAVKATCWIWKLVSSAPPSGMIKKGNAADTNAHTALLSLLLVMKTIKAQTPIVFGFFMYSPSVLVWNSTCVECYQGYRHLKATEHRAKNILYIKWFSIKLPSNRSDFCQVFKYVLFCAVVIELIQTDVSQYPFHQQPPAFLRAHRYRYWFTEPKADGSVISLSRFVSLFTFTEEIWWCSFQINVDWVGLWQLLPRALVEEGLRWGVLSHSAPGQCLPGEHAQPVWTQGIFKI